VPSLAVEARMGYPSLLRSEPEVEMKARQVETSCRSNEIGEEDR
jgi:hypothetical protein